MYIFLFIIAMLYLGGPIAVWLTQRQAANPQMQAYGFSLQTPGYEFLTATAERLRAMGFELVGYFGLVGQTKNVNMFLAYLIHRGNGDLAVAAMARTTQGTGTQLVEFATRFTDGSGIATGNSKTPGVYRRPRTKPVYHFPWVSDPARLYQFHQQLILRDCVAKKKDVPAPGKEADRLLDSMRQEMKDQVFAGILQLDSSRAWYKPTLVGAFVMTYKLLFPFKQIRGAMKQSKMRQLQNVLMSRAGAQPVQPIG